MKKIINDKKIYCYEDEFCEKIASEFIKRAITVQKEQQWFNVILGGGNTPILINRAIVDNELVVNVDWDKVRIFFSDERGVSKEHKYSNYKMIYKTLIKPLGIDNKNVYRIHGEKRLCDCIADYQKKIEFFLREGNVIHLAILGVGKDGHTASLFPNMEYTNDSKIQVVYGGKGEEGTERISLSKSALNSSKEIWILVNGIEKGNVIGRVIDNSYDSSMYPIDKISACSGETIYILDRASKEIIFINEEE